MLNRKRLVVAAIGVTFFGALVASAASLGALNSTSLGAANTVVASCDTDGVGIVYTNSYDAATGKYVVSTATISGINAACIGKTLSVTLSGAAGASLGNGTVVVAGATEPVPISNADSASVIGAAVVITG